jgi:hypothetical protein
VNHPITEITGNEIYGKSPITAIPHSSGSPHYRDPLNHRKPDRSKYRKNPDRENTGFSETENKLRLIHIRVTFFFATDFDRLSVDRFYATDFDRPSVGRFSATVWPSTEIFRSITISATYLL